ncbi:MAG: hypothetical protein PHF64_00765 [Methanoregula sp.]|nr:hypothetical protein [Methanoregula sp.]
MTKKKPVEQLQKRGRKKIPIDYEKAEKLAIILCTQSEIAAVLNVPLSTLEHDPEFLRIHKKGMETGKASLRRMQYKGAEAGNATMLIWLGKQHLGQRDRMEQEITGKDGSPIVHEYRLIKGVDPPARR